MTTNVITRGEPGMTSSSTSNEGYDLGGIGLGIAKNVTLAQALSPEHQLLHGGIHCGRIWKSPRAKDQCIQAAIKTFNGSPPFLDLGLFELDVAGCMVPTAKGITVSMARLPELAKLIDAAVRKAGTAGLLTRDSS